MARWIFALAFVLVCYGNGAACVESFVNYPSWRLIGASEYTAYHAFIGPRVIAFLVAPALLGTVCTALLLRSRPAAIPLWSVWVAVALQMVIWLSTAAIQWPIQQDLHAHGFSAKARELIEAAKLDGASSFGLTRDIVIPLLGPTIRISVFLAIIGSLQFFDLIWVMTQGGPIDASQTMATYMYKYSFQRFEIGYGAAVSLVIFTICVGFALLYQHFVLKRDYDGALA